MKTTIDISNALFAETKKVAGKKGSTFREVVETALRLYLKGETQPGPGFKLRKHPFRGQGMADDVLEGDWTKIRQRAYEGRGG